MGRMRIGGIFAVILLFCIIPSYALDCQYTEPKINETIRTLYLINGGVEDISPPFVVARDVRAWKQNIGYVLSYEFFVDNKIQFPLQVKVYFTVGGGQRTEEVMINPFGTAKISGDFDQAYPGVDSNNIHFEIKNLQILNESYFDEIEVCKLCNGQTCLNDGVACDSPYKCGGGHCIEGYCSNSAFCFNNGCNCGSNEIQCDDNKRCVKIGVVPLDVKPECNKPQECITGYIDSRTGLCAKSPSQIQQEEEQSILAEKAQKERQIKYIFYGILTFILFLGILWYFKKEYERVKRERIQKEIEKIQRQIELEEKNIQIIKATKEEIIGLEEELSTLKILKEELRIERLKPYTNKQGCKVHINENGYEVFIDSKILFHRWWFEHNSNRKIKEGYEIHHKDFKKLNNDIDNLEELTPQEHKRKHNQRYNK